LWMRGARRRRVRYLSWHRSRRLRRCRPRFDSLSLAVLELWLALLGEGACRLAVVLRLARADVVRRFHVEALVEVAVHGAIEVLLHVAVRDARAAGELTGS